MNTSDIGKTAASAVPSGASPDDSPHEHSAILADVPTKSLSPDFGHSTLDFGPPKTPVSPNFNNLSHSITEFHNENSVSRGQTIDFPTHSHWLSICAVGCTGRPDKYHRAGRRGSLRDKSLPDIGPQSAVA